MTLIFEIKILMFCNHLNACIGDLCIFLKKVTAVGLCRDTLHFSIGIDTSITQTNKQTKKIVQLCFLSVHKIYFS